MGSAADQIRPRAEFLKRLPTLSRQTAAEGSGPLDPHAVDAAIDFVLELKLERPTERYWLCTKGALPLGDALPQGWMLDYVTPQYRSRGADDWETGCPYGPSETSWLQGFDYLNFLGSESERLEEAYKAQASPEINRQLQAVWQEIDEVGAALRRPEAPAAAEPAPAQPVHLPE